MATNEPPDTQHPGEHDQVTQSLRSAFYNAVDAGNLKVVKDLAAAGVDIASCFHALERAAEKGDVKLLEFVLPQIDSLYQWQIRSLLTLAAQNDHVDAVRVILDWAHPVPKTADTTPPQPQQPPGPGT